MHCSAYECLVLDVCMQRMYKVHQQMHATSTVPMVRMGPQEDGDDRLTHTTSYHGGVRTPSWCEVILKLADGMHNCQS